MENNFSQHIEDIAKRLGISQRSTEKTAGLLASGATVPFIARYRKEMTGSLDEVQITEIRDLLSRLEDLDKRRESILASIEEQGLLSGELKAQILAAGSMSELEDLYLPYRPKRKTRASIARERGLEPLAKYIMAQGIGDPEQRAEDFIDPSKDVESAADALAGARDIIAEWVNEDSRTRSQLRRLTEREGQIESRVAKGKEKEGEKYASWFEWTENASKAPSHRILAMFRGENEGFLKIRIAPDEDTAYLILEKQYLKNEGLCAEQVRMAIRDSYKRLLHPSLETELRNNLKEKADRKAIEVFGNNLRQLLLTPPLGQKRILAIDPGFRSGCKVVCLDEEGQLLHNETIYPHPPVGQSGAAMAKIHALVQAYRIDAIAIGNGTAGRETENLVKRIRFDREVIAVMVNESGASVYSASDLAREEFPDYDVTVRGAVSIGRRLADPLAELVKIDPKSIGVGQYQHDVDQKLLKQALDDVVVSCVNAVGVEINTASKQLLQYVSGIGPALAESIINHRKSHGPIPSRKALHDIPRLGAKAFEQSAGFIRVSQSENPLDKSAVHPESYPIVEKMAADLGCSVPELMQNKSLRQQIDLQKYISNNTGLPTLTDIMQELDRPGRDPRKSFDIFSFDQSIKTIEDLREGMVLPGIVTNIVAFGAFVDIGLHNDGLVHISHLANRFVKDPAELVQLNQKVMVKVLSVDVERKRIALSMKEAES
ncbi:MAG: RNA-binding transcriptional accessory protein [Bacteroidia bacterium]|nr:MAG: RNA-binding transcriptional accessory protein [Bacteroidia bacterium]